MAASSESWDGVERRRGLERRNAKERRSQSRSEYDRRSGLDRRGHPLYALGSSSLDRPVAAE